MDVIRPIPRQDLRYEVTTRIVKLLVSGEPGERLPSERELSEELGVGRSTVREVVRSLAFMGADPGQARRRPLYRQCRRGRLS